MLGALAVGWWWSAPPLIHLPPLSLYPGATIISAEQSWAAYETTLRVPASMETVVAYYTAQLKQYDRDSTATLSICRANIHLPDHYTGTISVYVIPINVTESIAILRVYGDKDQPIRRFVGPPNQIFPTVGQPFVIRAPISLPSRATSIVQRSTIPQPPVYRGAAQIRFEQAYPLRIVTYDVHATAATVQTFYDEQFRASQWTYNSEYSYGFDNYAILQGIAQPAFSVYLFVIPIAPDRSIAQIVMYMSGPGDWEMIPPPPTPVP